MRRVNLRPLLPALVFTILGVLGMPSPSPALEGFRNIFVFADTRHFEFGSQTRLEFFTTLALEHDDPAPPAGIETLEVSGPDGRIHELLNSQANSSAIFFPPDGFLLIADYEDTNGDGIEEFPTGDYVFRLVTIAGETFTATKTLTTIAPLPLVNPVTPAHRSQVSTTPTLTWSAVPGDVWYRIRLFFTRSGFTDPEVSSDEPRLSLESSNMYTGPNIRGTSFTLPPGVVSPGRVYRWDVQVIDAPFLTQADNRTRRSDPDLLSIFSVPGPYGAILRKLGTVRLGDTQEVAVLITNPTDQEVEITAQVWLGLPTGVILSLAQEALTVRAGRVLNLPIYEQLFTAEDPTGEYSVGVQLLEPATGHRIGNEKVGRFNYTGN